MTCEARIQSNIWLWKVWGDERKDSRRGKDEVKISFAAHQAFFSDSFYKLAQSGKASMTAEGSRMDIGQWHLAE